MPGIYIHVPFCNKKCPYCDFYSLSGKNEWMDAYTEALKKTLSTHAEAHGKERVETVYFGGGTPNLLGSKRLAALLGQVKSCFDLAPAAEVTLEANPTNLPPDFFRAVYAAGFNRLSMGMQSAHPDELCLLGRRHTPEDVKRAVQAARDADFSNISLDLMLGLPGGSRKKLLGSIEFAAALGPEHISSYILKIEPGTPFSYRELALPDDDETAGQYLFMVEELSKRGYGQYEISNFARPGRESRHNLVYWHGEEYLGFGPGAHSFYGGKRFFYPRDLDAFLRGEPPCPDGEGGDFSEYAMLNLRLSEGLSREKCTARFGEEGSRGFEKLFQNAKKCPPYLLRADRYNISFTVEGFLVSNALLLRLLEGV